MSQYDENNAARKLADLEVKRNRTLADLDGIQSATRSTRRSIDGFASRHYQIMQDAMDESDDDSLSADDRKQKLDAAFTVFKKEVAMFQELLDEYERLQVQEQILVRMLIELDREVEVLRNQMM